MARHSIRSRILGAALATAALARGALGSGILQTSGFTDCGSNSTLSVQNVDIVYNSDNETVTFNVAGTSSKAQNVTAVLNVTAYGIAIYSNTFDPCATGVTQLCPVPSGTFSASGSQAIPSEYASMVPAIAYQIPDIDAQATLQLLSKDTGESVACIESQVSNGKTTDIPAVSYVAAGVAGAALLVTAATAMSGVVASGGSAAGGMGTVSPSFGEVFGWFHGMAMNGMLSVNYPSVYRSFSKNFGFSTGLIPWTGLQTAIDNFRASTGGNLTNDSIQYLHNATLVFADGSTETLSSRSLSEEVMDPVARAFARFVELIPRDITTSVSTSTNSSSNSTSSSSGSTLQLTVQGIEAYVEELSIPSANTFMTVLLIVAIVIAALAVSILLVKVVLEIWALFGSFPKSLSGFRKHYWGSIARAVTNLILLLYGVWVLYCIFQFTNGDSWAAKVLAGVTLAIFTGILAFFSWKIWSTARKLRRMEGDVSGLYEDKSIWMKYSLFYESYRKDYWWIFVPTIVYLFAKGCILAGADGHGMVQSIAQLIVEAVMLILLLWSRPYERRSGNVINIVIAVCRVLSVVCILVFVEEFGIAQTTQTVAGLVLIIVQSALTGILAILIAWNAIVACCKENPHRRRRKELEKLQNRSMDNLTPLDARNSLLKSDTKLPLDLESNGAMAVPAAGGSEKQQQQLRDNSPDRLLANDELAHPYRAPPTSSSSHSNLGVGGNNMYGASPYQRSRTPSGQFDVSRENLVANAAPLGAVDTRQPTLPNLEPASSGPYGGSAYGGRPYQGSYGPGTYRGPTPGPRGGY